MHNNRKMKQAEFFDHFMPDRCSAHNGVIAFNAAAKDKMAPLYYLVTHCELVYFIIATYYEISPAGGGCRMTRKRRAGRSATPTFSCSSLSTGGAFVTVLF